MKTNSSMPAAVKRYLHLMGGTLGLIGVIFVIMKLGSYAHEINLTRFNMEDGFLILFLSLLYGASNILLAQAWWYLLSFLGNKTTQTWAIKTYGISQLAKYVPGNIFHLAGRQAMGMAAGFKAGVLVKSTLWELGLLTVAGTLFSLLAVPLILPDVSKSTAIMAFIVLVIGCVRVMKRLLSSAVGSALLRQITFLAISGVIFIVATLIVTPKIIPSAIFIPLCGAYVVAWLAGLVTPGAPAGAGVREMVLLFLLDGLITPVDLLLVVVLGRIITILGDLFFFIIALKYFNERQICTKCP